MNLCVTLVIYQESFDLQLYEQVLIIDPNTKYFWTSWTISNSFVL